MYYVLYDILQSNILQGVTMKFKDLLRQVRKKHPKAIRVICEEMGFSKSYLTGIEQGNTKVPSPLKTAKLARVIGASEEDTEALVTKSFEERKLINLEELAAVDAQAYNDVVNIITKAALKSEEV